MFILVVKMLSRLRHPSWQLATRCNSLNHPNYRTALQQLSHSAHLSTTTTIDSSSSKVSNNNNKFNPPSALTEEIAFGIQDATKLYIRHGLGMQRLKSIAENAGNSNTLVPRWQMMMESFIGTQLHVLAGLGYATDEKGLGTYLPTYKTLQYYYFICLFFLCYMYLHTKEKNRL